MNGAATIDYKLLIITGLQGSGVHRLGRIMSCYENVHWYAHTDNGETPWTFSTTDKVKEAGFSKYHYDRIIADNNYLPLIGSRIEKYWDNDGWISNWYKIMSQFDLPNTYLTYIVHDSPKYLRELFPNSFIVNLITSPEYATARHLATSAKFRINYILENQLPSYESKWVKSRNQMLLINPNATVSELWCYTNAASYDEYVNTILTENHTLNKKYIDEQEYADVTTSWDTFDPLTYERYFGRIDINYKSLCNNDQPSNTAM